MITSITKAAILCCLIFSSLMGTAQNPEAIYLDYSGTCMNRFEYQYESGGEVSTGYEKYQAFTTPDVKLLLDVGLAKGEWLAQKPSNTRKCGTVLFDKELARSVNAKEDKVFIVKPDEGGYRVIPVKNIEVFEYVGDIIKFQDGKVSFDFQVGGLFEMRVKETSENTTYFKSEHELPCQKEIVFREFLSKTESTYSEIHLMAHLGIIYKEEVAHAGNKEEIRADYTVVRGNGHTINHFVADGCEGIRLIDPILEGENMGNATIHVATFEEDSPLSPTPEPQTTPAIQPPSPNTNIAVTTPDNPLPTSTNQQPEVNEGDAIYFKPVMGRDNYENLDDVLVSKGEEESDDAEEEIEKNKNTHTIEEGENLYRISLKYNTSVKEIQRLNDMGESTIIRVGQTIRIK